MVKHIKEGCYEDCGFNRLKKKLLMQKVRAEMMPDINASGNDKNILNEFYAQIHLQIWKIMFLIQRML